MKLSYLIEWLENMKMSMGDMRVMVNDDHPPQLEYNEALPEEGLTEYLNIR